MSGIFLLIQSMKYQHVTKNIKETIDTTMKHFLIIEFLNGKISFFPNKKLNNTKNKSSTTFFSLKCYNLVNFN